MEHFLGRQEAAAPSTAVKQNRSNSTRVSSEVITNHHPPPPSSGNDRKRAKTDDTRLTFRPNNRKTKRDYREELELMHSASDKIMSLNSENTQLRLRLEKAQADTTTLQLALGQERLALEKERLVSMDIESSNRTLRLMLLEERARTETRVQDSRFYRGTSMAPLSLSLPVPSILPDRRLAPARGMYAPPPVSPNTSLAPPREGVNIGGDVPQAMNEQPPLHSQLTAQRVRSELASIIKKSSR